MNQPLVSVSIITYNQADYIEASVLSAVEQDYDNLQVVVCDDASTDGTQEVLADLAAKYPQRLEVYFNGKNLGAGENRNRSLSYTRGELIAYLDGDDMLLPGKISKQVAFMLAHPECAISYHNVAVFDSQSGEALYDWKDRFGAGDGKVEELVQYGNFWCSISLMFRREHMAHQGFDARIPIGKDWLFFIHTLINGGGKFCYLDEVLARYRRHPGNLSFLWERKLQSKLISLDLIEQDYPQFGAQVRARRAEIYLTQSLYYLRRGELAMAGRALLSSLACASPTLWRLGRLPLRELGFFIRRRGKLDPLTRSLLGE